MRSMSMSSIARELPTACARRCDPPLLMSHDYADVYLGLQILVMNICSIPWIKLV